MATKPENQVDIEARQVLLAALRGLFAGKIDADTYWGTMPGLLETRTTAHRIRKPCWHNVTLDRAIWEIDRWACAFLIDAPVKSIRLEEQARRDQETYARIVAFLESGLLYEEVARGRVVDGDAFPWPFATAETYVACVGEGVERVAR